MTTTMISNPSPLTPTGTGHPAYSQSLPCADASVAIARLSVAATVRARGVEDLVDDARLIASELAVPAVPHIVQASETAQSGRGMAVVEALACRWGIARKPWGKGVWAECAIPGHLP
ncbi:hypothetical protein [Streptomyces sp. BRA346]|uniref:hypothetical protein n=1 Tax=Streptomyces sp. BRA346 TaxID=2878199 RepID=UPI004063F685